MINFRNTFGPHFSWTPLQRITRDHLFSAVVGRLLLSPFLRLFPFQITWLPSNASSLHLPNVDASSWVLVNVNQTGFYRVNYDASLWRKLTRSGVLKQIPPANRAQIIDDVMHLVCKSSFSFIFSSEKSLLFQFKTERMTVIISPPKMLRRSSFCCIILVNKAIL